MRRLLVPLAIAGPLLVGCQGGIGFLSPGATLSPPAWIQGSWANGQGTSFVFTNDDMTQNVQTGNSTSSVDFDTVYGAYLSNQASGSVYTITVNGNGIDETYTFTQTGSTTMTYALAGFDEANQISVPASTYTKQ